MKLVWKGPRERGWSVVFVGEAGVEDQLAEERNSSGRLVHGVDSDDGIDDIIAL